jgi:SNF2 family DNA or RNA helicase
MRLKKALRAKNSKEMKKIWASESLNLFPKDFQNISDANLATKFSIASQMLEVLYENLEEKIIIVSNYCETLDIMEKICVEKKYPVIRFDGKTKIAERQNIVDRFN